MGRIAELLSQEEMNDSERRELRDLVTRLEQVVQDLGSTFPGQGHFVDLMNHRVRIDGSGIAINGTGLSSSDPRLRMLRLFNQNFNEHLSLNLYDVISNMLAGGIALRAPDPGGTKQYPSLFHSMLWDTRGTPLNHYHELGIASASGDNVRWLLIIRPNDTPKSIKIEFAMAGTYADGGGYDRAINFSGGHITKKDAGAIVIQNTKSGSEVVVNEDGSDVDFRVEGSTVTDVLGVDAGLDAVTIGNYVRLDEVAAPGTPAAGTASVYVKTDGKLYLKDDAGTETDLTSGGGDIVGAVQDLTISAGSITITGDTTKIIPVELTPQTGTTDNLDDISGGSQGQMLILMSKTAGNTITARDQAGANGTKLQLGGDFAMNTKGDKLVLLNMVDLSPNSPWHEISRANNA